MITLRPYQSEAIEAVFDAWRAGEGNPLVELATGLGKSLVVAETCRRLIEQYPSMRILMAVHVRELVRQNYEELRRLWPDAPVGVYSAGLYARDTHHRIIFASIQSIYRRPDLFAPRHLVIVDEAHLVPADGAGMYLKLFEGLRQHYPAMRVMGLTATPFRLDSGRLDQGEGRIFDRIVYSYGVGAGVERGFLAPLTARAGAVEIDVGGVARRGGEFVPAALNAAANHADIVARACDDIIARGQDRKSWLVFCCGVNHATSVALALRERGVAAACVTGETPADDRDRMIADFKAGRLRALTNAMVLTTGFNAPGVDLIALLRPTLSTGLYVQMMGRGTRKADGKENCLVLDYAGNVRRHGPVDMVRGKGKAGGGGEAEAAGKVEVGEVRAKECPDCRAIVALGVRECPDCGYVFTPPKHEDRPDVEVAVMAREIHDDWAPVLSWSARKWIKRDAPDAPPTLRVSVLAGVTECAEWIAFEHQGFARQKAIDWWREHGGLLPAPSTVDEALTRWKEVSCPVAVTLRADGSFLKINRRRFAARPELEPSHA
jgi:DNA repair protein RadD